VKGGQLVAHVIWADQQLESILKQGSFTVHSVFDHAVNIANHDVMWTLVTRNKPKAPLTCVCDLETFLTTILNVGMPCHVFDNQLVLGKLQLDFPISSSSALTQAIGCFQSIESTCEGLNVLLDWCRLQSINEGALSLFNSPQDAISTYLKHSLQDFLLDFDIHKLPSLVGCGLGQTPSGDDVITAMLAMAYAFNHRGFIEVIRHLCEPYLKTTTPTSQSMLRHAFDGRFNALHTQLILSLKRPSEVHQAALTCANIGHTSGFDFIVGVLIYSFMINKGEIHAKANTNF